MRRFPETAAEPQIADFLTDAIPALAALATKLGSRPWFGGAVPHYGDLGVPPNFYFATYSDWLLGEPPFLHTH